MNLICTLFFMADQPAGCLRIHCNNILNGVTAAEIRKVITENLQYNYPVVFIDAKDVQKADLSAINEIIHSHYTLANSNSKLVFIYRRSTAVEKWVETTGLDSFMQTAILPFN